MPYKLRPNYDKDQKEQMTEKTQICTVCGEEKPATPEFFQKGKGFNRRCKECDARHKSKTVVKVYEYGAPFGPIEGAEFVGNQMWLAHLYKKKLTALECWSRALYRAARKEMFPDLVQLEADIEQLNSQRVELDEKIKTQRQVAGKKLHDAGEKSRTKKDPDSPREGGLVADWKHHLRSRPSDAVHRENWAAQLRQITATMNLSEAKGLELDRIGEQFGVWRFDGGHWCDGAGFEFDDQYRERISAKVERDRRPPSLPYYLKPESQTKDQE